MVEFAPEFLTVFLDPCPILPPSFVEIVVLMKPL